MKFFFHDLVKQSPEGKLWADQLAAGDLIAGAFAVNQGAPGLLGSQTIASAATISPVCNLVFITGTTQIATINPPLTGMHMLILIFTNGAPGALLTSGNIKAAVTPAQNVPVLLFWDPVSSKWWAGILKAS